MPDVNPQLLAQVLGDVLAETAFTFVEPSPEASPAWKPPVLHAALTFEADKRGRLRLATALATAEELAANMLGVEPGDPEAKANARFAVSEILNVIGGALVVKLYGTERPSRLGLPEPGEGPPVSAAPGGWTVAVLTETGDPIQLQLELSDPV